jgi:long-chain acyl-CoA synthetase
MLSKEDVEMNAIDTIANKLRDAAEQLTSPGSPFEVERRQTNGVDLLAYKNAPATLRDALSEGRAHGDKAFITFESESYSFQQYFESVDRLAYHLVNHYSICKGDRVAIAMRNYPEWMMAFNAIISVGAIVVPLNSWGREDELVYSLNDAGAKLVFCDQQRAQYLADNLQQLNCMAVVVRSQDGELSERMEPWASTQTGSHGMPDVDISSGDPVMLMYTSGTTGKPKGAVSTNFAICQAVFNFEVHSYISAMANPETIEEMMGSGFEPATLLAVPLFHVSGCHSVFLLSLRGGRKVSIMYKWNPEQALSIIEQERITIFVGVPTMSLALFESPAFPGSDTSSLYSIGAGGAACPPHLKDLIYGKLPHAYPGTGYGMTETNAVCANCTGEAFKVNPSSSGTLSPIVECKTVDDQGQTLPSGQVGEIYIKSPTNVSQYWNLPEASAGTFIEGWVATGDIGYVDSNNFIYIVDRKKDMVIRGGENIFPVELEGILQTNGDVLEASAYGVPHDKWGEELAATVSVHADSTVTEEQLKLFVAQRVAAYKVPSYITLSKEPLAKNATGKLLKKEIRQAFLDSL